MTTVWNRFKITQKATRADKKLEDWQNQRPSRPYQTYSYTIKGGREGATEKVKEQSTSLVPSLRTPPTSLDHTRSQNRPASCIFPQQPPTHTTNTFSVTALRKQIYTEYGISPPSSPENSPTNSARADGNVSPIEDEAEAVATRPAPRAREPFQGQSVAKPKDIPQMRRDCRQTRDAQVDATRMIKSKERLQRSSLPLDNEMRWNPLTVHSATHKQDEEQASQDKLQHDGHGLRRAGSSAQARQAARAYSPLDDRARQARQQLQAQAQKHNDTSGTTATSVTQLEPRPRPGWRDASGRNSIVIPVHDSPHVAPLMLPRRSSKRLTRQGNGGVGATGALLPARSAGLRDSETPPSLSRQGPEACNTVRSADRGQNDVPETLTSPAQAIPNTASSDVFTGTARATSPPYPDQPMESSRPGSVFYAPQSLSHQAAIRRKPTGASARASAHSPFDAFHSGQRNPTSLPEDRTDDWTDTAWSQSADSESTDEAPRSAVGSPSTMARSEQRIDSGQPARTSILDRKRPVVSGYEHVPRNRVPSEPIKLNMDSPYYMKPAVSTTFHKPKPRPITYGHDGAVSATSVSAVEKSLPPAPPEESARGCVAELRAKLQALANRRLNIHQAIKQMTELMPTDNLLASEAVVQKRAVEKRKVEALRDELSDIQRDEYVLGLKLHRAYKRLDRDAEYEPTTLWVRRVTG